MEHLSKDWIDAPQNSAEYRAGVDMFLDFAFQNVNLEVDDDEPEILCSCAKCVNCFWFTRTVVYDHLIANKFNSRYKVQHFHGEGLTASSTRQNMQQHQPLDDVNALLNDAFRDVLGETLNVEDIGVHEGVDECLGDDAKKLYKLVEDAQEELYVGCKDFTVLSFTIRLYLLKCVNRWSNSSFTDLMKTLREVFPFAKIPKSFTEAKNMVRRLGLDYKKIDACPNHCMLYWKEHENDTFCHICKASRWKLTKNEKKENVLPDHGTPAKVLRYFPLTPRLQRLFMCSKTARHMTWHETERPKDGKFRHPADAHAIYGCCCLIQQRANKTNADPTPGCMFVETRKEKKKRKIDDPRNQMINDLQQSEEINKQPKDRVTTIATIFGKEKEKKRRLPLHGRGVTCTLLKQTEFQEQLRMEKDKEVQAIQAEYEEKRKRDKAEVATALQALMAHMQCHNPTMPPVDPAILGSLLGDVSSAANVSGAIGSQIDSTSRLRTSTSSNNYDEQQLFHLGMPS